MTRPVANSDRIGCGQAEGSPAPQTMGFAVGSKSIAEALQDPRGMKALYDVRDLVRSGFQLPVHGTFWATFEDVRDGPLLHASIVSAKT